MPTTTLNARWGGGRKAHPPIIIKPRNRRSDLILTSEVFVQSFLSLQRHEYHYKAENGSNANGVNCNMSVEWVGPQIRWSCLSPGLTDTKISSYFSPQRMRTSADADVLAGIGRPVQARQVRGEVADAYVPWTQQVWNNLWDLVKDTIKDTMKPRILFSNVASASWRRGGVITLESTVGRTNEKFLYGLRISNSKINPVKLQIVGVLFQGKKLSSEMTPGSSQNWSFESDEIPGEARSIFEFQIPQWETFGPTRFPVAILVPKTALEEEQ